VGAVAAREVPCFARNSREWQQLVEVCRVVDTVLIDLETVYSPRHSNDRLLLGLKGSLNEYELDLLRQRSVEARRAKAQRGELLVMAPVGYLKTDAPHFEKDPDRRVHDAVTLVFRKFAELGTVRQTFCGSWSTAYNCPCPPDRATRRGDAPPTPCCIACSAIRSTAVPMRTGKRNALSTMTGANRAPAHANRARGGWP